MTQHHVREAIAHIDDLELSDLDPDDLAALHQLAERLRLAIEQECAGRARG